MLHDGIETNLSLENRDRIEQIRKRYGHETSSHAFNTLFIWKNFVGNRLYLEEDLYSVKYVAKGKEIWTFPCGDSERGRAFIEKHRHTEGFGLCYLREEDKSLLEQWFPNEFRIEESSGDNEYLISCENHLVLAGRAYAKLRGKIRKVEKEFKVSTTPLTEENIETAVQLTRDWIGGKSTENPLHIHGNEADQVGLRMFRKLGITGLILYLDDQPFGVVAGFPLSEDTYDLFLAKEKQLLPGLGYYLKRELIRSLPDNYLYVNLEDDLGIEGLRIMKEQMIPVRKNEMWTATYIGDTDKEISYAKE